MVHPLVLFWSIWTRLFGAFLDELVRLVPKQREIHTWKCTPEHFNMFVEEYVKVAEDFFVHCARLCWVVIHMMVIILDGITEIFTFTDMLIAILLIAMTISLVLLVAAYLSYYLHFDREGQPTDLLLSGYKWPIVMARFVWAPVTLLYYGPDLRKWTTVKF